MYEMSEAANNLIEETARDFEALRFLSGTFRLRQTVKMPSNK
jgi:hypothetical protein